MLREPFVVSRVTASFHDPSQGSFDAPAARSQSMTAAFPAIERDKSPLIDADHEPVRIAHAMRGSPHILGARAEPGSDRVTFTTLAGNGFHRCGSPRPSAARTEQPPPPPPCRIAAETGTAAVRSAQAAQDGRY